MQKQKAQRLVISFFSTLLKSTYKISGFWSRLIIGCIVLAGLFIVPVFLYFSKDLPDYKQLLDYDPPTITRIYSGEGDLMAEIATERRIFKKIDEMPQLIINSFIAAEDKNYYQHPGIDLLSIIRAATHNLMNIGSDHNPVGGSTITQQVVKNFLLNNERSISRKIKEAILAYRINKIYSKDRILELYLNQIYLGHGAYGVTSAALAYFNKDLKDLTVEEAALIAAMPKAPSSLDPTRHHDKAKVRRNWVIERMLEEHYIDKKQAKAALDSPIVLKPRFETAILDNGYYTESVRLEMIEKYGYDSVYQNGFSVYTNLHKTFQKYADEALREGILEYDRRHGYAGPIKNVNLQASDWKAALRSIPQPEAAGHWKLAIVLSVSDNNVVIGLSDGEQGNIPLSNLTWARKKLDGGYLGKKIEKASEVLKAGDVILTVFNQETNSYTLEQVPEVNGAIVIMQNKTGRVLAMTGGYSFKESKYNRAIQALRQPGSAFKPIVYLAALNNGWLPTSIVYDEPLSIPQGPGMPNWTPKNYEGKVLGPITLRKALEKSKNLATVYLIKELGVKPVAEEALKLKIYDSLPHKYLSVALGAMETTLMKLTAAFSTFASNGQLIEGHLVDRIQDRKGNLIYTSDKASCANCNMIENVAEGAISSDPILTYKAQKAIDPMVNYQLVSMLQGAVERGTAARARQLNRVVAGKTGTSNESNDTWFIGFTPDITVGVFIGHDAPKSLGAREQGSSVALPVFIRFMKKAANDIPNREFFVPEGISFINVDTNTGEEAGITTASKDTAREALKPGDKIGRDKAEEEPSSFFSLPFNGDDKDEASDVNFGGGGVY